MKKQLVLRKNEERRINAGHQWIFSNEIASITGDPQAGDIVELSRSDGRFLGLGFYNPHSLIAYRHLTRQREEISTDFFRGRIERAYAIRNMLFPEADAFRVVHGESDYLPGLVVDKYTDYCSIQTLSAGMDSRLPLIADLLESTLHVRAIVERNDAPVRLLEGLEQRKQVLRGTLAPCTIHEGGIAYSVDLLQGQKTGSFLDQRENRLAIRRYARNASVLDCFCNEGGFALNAAAGGAKQVLGIDSSERAIQQARTNVKLNGYTNIQFEVGNVFDRLKELLAAGDVYDLVILDPPSFTKSRRNVTTALQGYKSINMHAMRLLRPGGVLLTASCSHHITEEAFMRAIGESAISARRSVRLLQFCGAAPDHPVLPGMPETAYLKLAILSVD